MMYFGSPNLNFVFAYFFAHMKDLLVWENHAMKEKWTKFQILQTPVAVIQSLFIVDMFKSVNKV